MGLGRGSPLPSPPCSILSGPRWSPSKSGGGERRGAAGPRPGRGSRLARPPRRRRYLAGGRPLGECFQQGPPRCGGDLQRQQQQQHEQERRRGHHSGGEHATAGSRGPGKKPPLTRRWPGPQAEPASRAHAPRGPGLVPLGISTFLSGSFFPSQPHPSPIPPHTPRQVLGPPVT